MQDKTIKISKETIVTNLICEKKEEVLKTLSDLLLKQGYVKEGFYDSLMNREKDYPTGLNTDLLGVALPHTNPEFVVRDSLCLAILKEPVIFHEMTNPQGDVKVKVVFLLALTDATKHLKILQKVVEIIKDSKTLNELLNKNQDELNIFLNQRFNVESSSILNK